MFVIEQPIPLAPTVDSAANVLTEWNAVYDAHNEVACLMLGSMTPELHRQFENYSPYEMLQELKSMFEKQARVERFDLIQTFHACKQEEDKPVTAYVLKMKGYLDQLERLGYVLPQDLSVGLILNGLTRDFVGFVINYNMHNTGKTIGELHAMLIEYEKVLPKKAKTPKGKDKQVNIPKPKNPKPTAKEHPAKDDTCHHCKEVGHWKRNCLIYLVELLKKKKQVSTASFSSIFTIELFSFPTKSWVYDTGCGTHICITKQGLRGARKLEQGALYLYVGNGVCAQVEAIGSFDLVLPNGLCFTDYGISVSKNDVLYFNSIPRDGKMTRKPFSHRTERATDLLEIIHTDVCGPLRHVSRQACGIVQQLTPPYTPQHNGVSEKRNRTLLDMVRSMMNLTTLPLSFWDYALEPATRILNMVPTKTVYKTPYELRKVPNLSYLKVWGCEALVKRDTPDKLQQRSVKCIFIGYPKETMVSGRAIDLEEIQDEDTPPSEITNEVPIEVEGFEPPQQEVIPIRRSERTHRAPNRLCLNVEAEKHSLGDLNEPTSNKSAMLDPSSTKWLDVMNAKMQSMMDNNKVWVVVDLPPNCKTVGSKWIFKKKPDMDGIVHTYKARLLAKGYTQLYGVDYEETFSPVADIRAIRILISIAAFYDYEIWKMDVKTAFLNGFILIKHIYGTSPEGLLDPKHRHEKYVNFKDPFLILNKLQEAGIKDLIRKSKSLGLLKILMSHVYIKRLVGVMLHFSLIE
ncbi:retrovirus-related pol polyprotein from transposon TNT 1-94 [Tanacetum coccineum]